MTYRILTYADPYRLEENDYWEEIRRYPHLCASKTLVKGMNHLYRNQLESIVCTVDLVVRTCFEDWCNSYETYIRQYVALTGMLDQQLADEDLPYKQAIKHNQADLLAAIRLLKELALDSRSINLDRHAEKEHRLLWALLKQIEDESVRLFEPTVNHIPDISQVMINVAETISQYYELSSDLEMCQRQQSKLNVVKDNIHKHGVDKLVVHGLHQFKPLMLRLFDHLIDNHVEVIFLFNYQHQYRHIYETWLNVYSIFESEVQLNNQIAPCGPGKNLLSSIIAKCFGAFAEGTKMHESAADVTVIEFDTMTEYANYIADCYITSQRTSTGNPVKNMSERFYSADSSVNDILKLYFPDQFGERHFLTYPIGQFFSALYQLWDHRNKTIKYDVELLREVFNAGVYFNDPTAHLLTVFNRVELYCKGSKDSHEAVTRLESLILNIAKINESEEEVSLSSTLSKFDFFRLKCEDIEKVIGVLHLLETTAQALFSQETGGALAFGPHFEKVNQFLAEQANMDLVASQEKKVLNGLQQKLAHAQTLDINGTFDDLQNSIGYYLKQVTESDETEFLVNNYEQIEGDIWTSKGSDDRVTYHFGCLSDDRMQRNTDSNMPWPLSVNFFEHTISNMDRSCQIYLTAATEYNAFIRYQLFHGWYFNQRHIKISYVKNVDSDKPRQPFFFLNLIGAKYERPPEYVSRLDRQSVDADVSTRSTLTHPVGKQHAQIFTLCPYRFFNEILLHQYEQAGYSNEFLCKVYYTQVILLRTVWQRFSGVPIIQYYAEIDAVLDAEMSKTELLFPFWKTYADLYDIRSKFKRYFAKTCLNNGYVRIIDDHFLHVKEDFVFNKYTDEKTSANKVSFLTRYEKYPHTRAEIGGTLLQFMNTGDPFQTKPDSWCRQCNCDSYCLERVREENATS